MKRRLGVGLLSLAVVGAVGAWFALGREPTLLDRATRLARNPKLTSHTWLSDHEILLLMGGNNHFRVARLDLPAKTYVREMRLDRVFNGFNIDWCIHPSPDGQWLLCSAFDGEQDAHIVRLSDGHVQAQNVDGSVHYAWLPGTMRWLALCPKWNTEKQVEEPLSGRIFDMKMPARIETLRATKVINTSYGDAPVALPDGRLIVPSQIEDGSQSNQAFCITDCRIESDRIVPIHRYLVSFPGRSGNTAIAVCPNGWQVAWATTSEPEEPSAWHRFLLRWLPRFAPKQVSQTILYISRLDGTGRRELGRIAEEFIGDLQWTPDGRRVSFLCKDALWMMHVSSLTKP